MFIFSRNTCIGFIFVAILRDQFTAVWVFSSECEFVSSLSNDKRISNICEELFITLSFNIHSDIEVGLSKEKIKQVDGHLGTYPTP